MNNQFWSVKNVGSYPETFLEVDLSAVGAIERQTPYRDNPRVHVRDTIVAQFEAGGTLELCRLDMSDVDAQAVYADLMVQWRRAKGPQTRIEIDPRAIREAARTIE